MKGLAAALVVLAATSVSAQELTTVVGAYCATCHHGRLRSPGGLLLDTLVRAHRRRGTRALT